MSAPARPACRRQLPCLGRATAAALAALAFGPRPAAADPGDTVAAVAARTSADYARDRRPDGTFSDEFYAFGEGGYYRAPIHDGSIDHLKFLQVARDLAAPLARQRFLPAKDASSARLLIMVYWGMTTGTADPASDPHRSPLLDLAGGHTIGSHYALVPGSLAEVRGTEASATPGLIVLDVHSEIQDARNAAVLGYDANLSAPNGYQATARRVEHDDLVEEIQHDRYFVVLMAYDFQLLRHQRRHKLVWETRFSVRAQGNRFDELLPRMASYSAQYFGENTDGLIRRPLPVGEVEIGAPRVVAATPAPREALADAALRAGSGLLEGGALAAPPRPALPPDLSRRIAAYQAEKIALQDTLTARIANTAPGEEAQQAIDRFNREYAARIVGLQRDGEAIRGAMVAFAASQPAGPGQLTIDDLQRQFSASAAGSDLPDSLFTHP